MEILLKTIKSWHFVMNVLSSLLLLVGRLSDNGMYFGREFWNLNFYYLLNTFRYHNLEEFDLSYLTISYHM